MKLYDAHSHLPQPASFVTVVNSTCESDWPRLQAHIASDSCIPAFGLHPWHVGTCSKSWQTDLLRVLECAGKSGSHISGFAPFSIGEIGLDSTRGASLDKQIEAFQWQHALAAERELAVSIHCVKAWDALLRVLKTQPRPRAGFLLHAYSGSAAQVATLTELGAYFSFSPAFLRPERKKLRAALLAVPDERLLLESDATPDVPIPTSLLLSLYQEVARERGIEAAILSESIEQNFKRLFGRGAGSLYLRETAR
jgi:TatD DNase family protein